MPIAFPITNGMDIINKLASRFAAFPGIGPRQSKRFVYYLLRQRKEAIDELIELLGELKKGIHICPSCYRFSSVVNILCSICSDENRSKEVIMIVEKDVDIDTLEKSGVFNGKFFVLGGTVSYLDKNPEQKVRSKELLASIKTRAKDKILKEIILALSLTPEGEETGNYVTTLLSPIIQKNSIKISMLGRGLSTGSELEYSDAETLRNAFAGRR